MFDARFFIISSPEPKAPRWAISIPVTPTSVGLSTFSNISLKPLGQLSSNFIWRLLRMEERQFVQIVLVTWSRWPPCSYMVKTLLKSSSPELEGRWGCGAYQVCSNDDPGLTLIYLTSRSNLLPNAFKWGNFGKVDFLKTIEAKVIVLTWYVLSIVTMAINKIQRSRLTFQPRPLILESHQYIKTWFFLKPFGQFNSNLIWRLRTIS